MLLRKFYDASSEERVAKQPNNRLVYRHAGRSHKQSTMAPTEDWVWLSVVLSFLSANKVIKLWKCTVCLSVSSRVV
jgi:hypothetical protein